MVMLDNKRMFLIVNNNLPVYILEHAKYGPKYENALLSLDYH